MARENNISINYNRAFLIGIILNLSFIIIEVIFGILASSMALLADAGHNLSDVFGLLLAWGAYFLGKRGQTQRRTYGWKKFSVLASFLNSIILLIVIGGVAWEAIRRFYNPVKVEGLTIILVAAVGVIINTFTALLFISGRKTDLNIRGAFIHMASDAGVSAAVVLAGLGILATGWFWLDPAMSLIIVSVILIGTWGLLHDSFNLAIDAVPKQIDPEAVRNYLKRLPRVQSVHDLHIWGMSTTEVALTVHLVGQESEIDNESLAKLQKNLGQRFGINHVTIQWEMSGGLPPCKSPCEIKN